VCNLGPSPVLRAKHPGFAEPERSPQNCPYRLCMQTFGLIARNQARAPHRDRDPASRGNRWIQRTQVSYDYDYVTLQQQAGNRCRIRYEGHFLRTAVRWEHKRRVCHANDPASKLHIVTASCAYRNLHRASLLATEDSGSDASSNGRADGERRQPRGQLAAARALGGGRRAAARPAHARRAACGDARGTACEARGERVRQAAGRTCAGIARGSGSGGWCRCRHRSRRRPPWHSTA
jgi:hypothetical protein